TSTISFVLLQIFLEVIDGCLQNNVFPTGYCTASLSSKPVKNIQDKTPNFSSCFLSLPLQVTTVTTGVATSCCETSLCNISGASSVKTSYTMIALGVLASLACILHLGF
uniref:UPAR/Ly6 domain-containing protein n=1 Tax=Strix occidentalis caurina TaxID=311401 RepID=A0A8D0EQJ5_STROC